MSILPRYIGELLVKDITSGKRIEVRGIIPYSMLICYLHTLKFKIHKREFALPVALADSDVVPSILGRINGLDIFDARFIEGEEVRMKWREREQNTKNRA